MSTELYTGAKNSCLVVVCKSVGNPDYHQDPHRSISPLQKVPCSTFAEAAKACQQYIGEWDLGGGNWAGGQVYHPVKGLIALVSYNGKVWQSTTGKWAAGMQQVPDMNNNDY